MLVGLAPWCRGNQWIPRAKFSNIIEITKCFPEKVYIWRYSSIFMPFLYIKIRFCIFCLRRDYYLNNRPDTLPEYKLNKYLENMIIWRLPKSDITI